MGTVPGSAQLSSSNSPRRRAFHIKIMAYQLQVLNIKRISRQYESNSAASGEEGAFRRRKKKNMKKGSIKQAEDAIWRFKNRDLKRSGLKKTRASSSLYKKVL